MGAHKTQNHITWGVLLPPKLKKYKVEDTFAEVLLSPNSNSWQLVGIRSAANDVFRYFRVLFFR